MPLHNIAYDDFNKEHHDANDGIVEDTILNEPEKIARHMYPITLSKKDFEADLAREIARIANLSRKLGYKLRAEKRDMTKQEAYIQLGHSASLLRAVLQHYNRMPASAKGVGLLKQAHSPIDLVFLTWHFFLPPFACAACRV